MLTALVIMEDIREDRTPMPMTWKIWGANCRANTRSQFLPTSHPRRYTSQYSLVLHCTQRKPQEIAVDGRVADSTIWMADISHII